MLDALKNLGNLPALMAKAREMQEKLKSMQDELARKTVTADAGGGMVEATVNGKLELVKLRIDRSRVDPNDTEMVEDLTVAAVRAAQAKAADMARQEMEKVTGGLGSPRGCCPGCDTAEPRPNRSRGITGRLPLVLTRPRVFSSSRCRRRSMPAAWPSAPQPLVPPPPCRRRPVRTVAGRSDGRTCARRGCGRRRTATTRSWR
jgi:DNA-binding YbaB/EbfC family protein